MSVEKIELSLNTDEHPHMCLQLQLNRLSADVIDGDSMQESISFFKDLYKEKQGGGGFRHDYSSISKVLYRGKTPETLTDIREINRHAQMLSSNLKQISDELTKSEQEDSRVTKCLSKLCDHVTLEMQRMTVFESLYSEIEKTRNEFSETAEKGTAFIEATIENQKSELEKLGEDNEKSIRKVQRDYIAILGIFAAVVLVFNSSIGFSSSVVEVAGAKYSFSNLLLIVLIIGFIIANTVAVLFGFVWKMIREDDDHAPAAAWKTLSMMNAILIVGIICLLVRSLFFPGIPWSSIGSR